MLREFSSLWLVHVSANWNMTKVAPAFICAHWLAARAPPASSSSVLFRLRSYTLNPVAGPSPSHLASPLSPAPRLPSRIHKRTSVREGEITHITGGRRAPPRLTSAPPPDTRREFWRACVASVPTHHMAAPAASAPCRALHQSPRGPQAAQIRPSPHPCPIGDRHPLASVYCSEYYPTLAMIIGCLFSNLRWHTGTDFVEQSGWEGLWEWISELVMWRNVAKSSLWFGFGSMFFLSCSFSREITFRHVNISCSFYWNSWHYVCFIVVRL
jgi:hypothetical protein